MKLRKPCEHKDDEYPEGHYEPHKVFIQESVFLWHYEDCPGGVFLPDDTLIIEDRDKAIERIAIVLYNSQRESPSVSWNQLADSLRVWWRRRANFILDALSVRDDHE